MKNTISSYPALLPDLLAVFVFAALNRLMVKPTGNGSRLQFAWRGATTLLFIVMASLTAYSGTNKGFTIKGTVRGLDTGVVSLVYANIMGDDTTVTSKIIAGKFVLCGQVPEPELARFTIQQGWIFSIAFFLENKEINMNLVKNETGKTEISGSSSNIVYQKLAPQMADFFSNARNYDAAIAQAKASRNKDLQKSADSIWALQQQQWIQTLRSTITMDSRNYTGLYFVRWLLFHPTDFDTIYSLFMSLDSLVRNGYAGKNFMAIFEQARKTSAGQPAPEITARDTSGYPVTLAALKGKVVLLDFWALYCGPCRQENKAMKAVYEKYYAKGFEIVSVSLDNDRNEWIKAIRTDNMSWPQCSDLRGGASANSGLYDVTDLPRNFLIDRSGKLITKDIHGENLTGRLDELLK